MRPPDEVPWAKLPDRCALQLQWSPEPELLSNWLRHDVQTPTIARHPLGVPISVSHVSTTRVQTSLWFGGRCGSEESIRGCQPSSREFLDYATGPRAQALLSTMRDWWRIATCGKLRYEGLVANPDAELHRLAHSRAHASSDVLRAAIHENSLEHLRSRVQNQHFWQGIPGHWKRLLSTIATNRIAQADRTVFETLEYVRDPDDHLTPPDANWSWFALGVQSLRKELSRTRAQLLDFVGQRRGSETQIEEALTALTPRCASWGRQRSSSRRDCRRPPRSIRGCTRLHHTAYIRFGERSDEEHVRRNGAQRAVCAELRVAGGRQHMSTSFGDHRLEQFKPRERRVIERFVNPNDMAGIDVTGVVR